MSEREYKQSVADMQARRQVLMAAHGRDDMQNYRRTIQIAMDALTSQRVALERERAYATH